MQQEAPAKGPRVYLDYTQAELDAAYDQAAYAPNQPQLGERRVAGSELARKRLGSPDRFAYGDSEIEKLDVFRAAAANAPIFVFIHGGAWRNGVAKDHAYAAEMFHGAGITYVVPDFVLVQDAGGSLFPMAEQVRRAIAWCWKNAKTFGGNPDRLYIGGHSSGAHLAGCALIADWPSYGVPDGFIKGATLCSGMYDLVPVRLSKRSQYVAFTDEMVEKLSAIRHIDKIKVPRLTLCYGTKETPEFQRQPQAFAAALEKAGKKPKLVVGQHYNHFEIGETFANPYGVVGREILEQMGIRLVPG